MKPRSDDSIVFFDGVCNLCNGFVNFLIAKSSGKNIFFSTLQGQTAQKQLSVQQRQLDSVVFLKAQNFYEKSDAILMIFKELGGFWKCFLVFKLIPKRIRDLIYNQISQHRYSIFGKKDFCRLPTAGEISRFLP